MWCHSAECPKWRIKMSQNTFLIIQLNSQNKKWTLGESVVTNLSVNAKICRYRNTNYSKKCENDYWQPKITDLLQRCLTAVKRISWYITNCCHLYVINTSSKIVSKQLQLFYEVTTAYFRKKYIFPYLPLYRRFLRKNADWIVHERRIQTISYVYGRQL